MKIKKVVRNDQQEIFNLYQRVAEIPGGLARLKGEITPKYVEDFINKTVASGVGFIAINNNKQVIGEIHAYSPNIFSFSHVYSELTIAVDPIEQGQGVGRLLLEELISHVTFECPDILRIELIVRESNKKAICFYTSLGFEAEGFLVGRIKNKNGTYEADIPMAWSRA